MWAILSLLVLVANSSPLVLRIHNPRLRDVGRDILYEKYDNERIGKYENFITNYFENNEDSSGTVEVNNHKTMEALKIDFEKIVVDYKEIFEEKVRNYNRIVNQMLPYINKKDFVTVFAEIDSRCSSRPNCA